MATRSRALAAALLALGALALLAWLAFGVHERTGSAAAEEARTTAAPRPAELAAPAEEDAPRKAPAPARSALVAEPAPAAGAAAFLGTVVAPDGAPIEGADVRLVRKSPRWRAEPPLGIAASDAEGRFRIEVARVPDEPLVLMAFREGCEGRQHDPAEAGVACAIELPWAPAVFGTVRDARTREPLAGTRGECDGEWTESAPDGSYRLATVPLVRPVELRARLDGWLERVERLERHERAETRLDLALRRGAPVVLTVVDRDTKAPVAGAEARWRRRGEVVATSDALGELALAVAPGEGFGIAVTAEGYGTTEWRLEVVRPERWGEPRLPLQGVAWIEGAVRDEEGAPVAGARVRASPRHVHVHQRMLGDEERAELGLQGYAHVEPLRESAVTDVGGRYALPVLPGDLYEVHARVEGFAIAREESPPIEIAGARVAVDLVLERGGTVRGRVLRNGAPWTAGAVEALRAGEDRTTAFSRIAGDGAYELTGVAPGAVLVRVRDELGGEVLHETTIAVEAGEEHELDLVWTIETSAISGTVRDASGAPLGAFPVHLRDESEARGRSFSWTRTAEDGTWTAEVRPGTTYTVSVQRGPIVQRIEGVRPGATGVDFVLDASGRIRVALVEAAGGEPIALGAVAHDTLAWRPTGTTVFRPYLQPTRSEGALVIEVPAGTLDLVVDLAGSGFVPRIVGGVRVGPGEEVAVVAELTRGLRLDLELERDSACDAGTLRGHLVFALERSELDAIRGPLPAGSPEVNHTINGLRMHLAEPTFLDRLVQLDGGIQRLDALPPGTYSLRAFPDDLVLEPRSIELREERDEPLVVRCRRR